MKPSERKHVVKSIRGLVPELHAKGRLLAATPRGRILRGVFLDASSQRGKFYALAFMQPLYIPSETLAFNLGDRLGGINRTWGVSDAEALAVAVRDEGRPFFGQVSTPEELTAWSFLEGRPGAYSLEVRAFSLVVSGRYAEGAKALRELADFTLGDDRAWVVEARQRERRLADLAENDPDAAHALLNKWEEGTIIALRVQDIP